MLQGRNRVKVHQVDAENCKNDRHLQIVLLDCERAWALAQELKDDMPAEGHSRIASHIVRRLKKASKCGGQLASICEKNCDARTSLEAQAYASYLEGLYRQEVEEWKDALSCMESANTIYTKLMSVASESEKVAYSSRLDEIAPSIRYCQYNIMRKQGTSDPKLLEELRASVHSVSLPALNSKLDALLAESVKADATTMQRLTWMNQHISLSSDELRTAFLKVREANNRWEDLMHKEGGSTAGEETEGFDLLIAQVEEGRKCLNNEWKAAKKVGINDEQQRTYDLLFDYLDFLSAKFLSERQTLNAQRLHALIPRREKGQKPGVAQFTVKAADEAWKLHDTIMQGIDEILSLQAVQNSGEGTSHWQLERSRQRAWRALCGGRSMGERGRWKEAYALASLAAACAEEAQGHPALGAEAGSFARYAEAAYTRSSLEEETEVTADIADLEVGAGGINPSDRKRVLVPAAQSDILSMERVKRMKLVHFPPQMVAVPAKPILFDLAFEHMPLPVFPGQVSQPFAAPITQSLGESVQMSLEDEKKEKDSQKKGILGGISSWWGKK